MKNKNAAYWKERFAQLEAAQNKMAASCMRDIEKIYREAEREIEGKIDTWYRRFADNNGISLAEARQWLAGNDLKEFKWTVKDYIKHGEENALSGQWIKELENASAKFHISKLEALKIHTRQSLEALFSKQNKKVHSLLGDVFTENYYKTVYEVQKGIGIGFDVTAINQSYLDKVLSKPWAADGKNFSDRIWANKNKLINEMHSEISRGLITGSDPQKTIDMVAKKMNTSKTNAGRLVMTEEAYFNSAAQKDGYKELGIEEYEILATLDSHTSKICQDLDGKRFFMKDYEAGVTAPPFHVYCRSTTVPYIEDFDIEGERIARDPETDRTYYIPDDMKYKDWKETFVDGGDKSGFDVLSDGTALHYSYHKEPKPQKSKKVYMTEKKLKSLIADADVQLEDLENAFLVDAYGYTHEQAMKDFNGDINKFANDLYPGDADKIQKLKDLHSQMEALAKQKEEWTVKLNEKLIAKQKKALAKEQLDLEAQKAALQQQLDDIEIKTYSGIWYNKDVTTADWKGLNIQGKKQYYQSEIAKGTLDPAKQAQFEEYIKQLDELDSEGKSYADIQAEFQKVQAQIQKVQSDLQKLENGGIMDAVDDAYTQARKDAAMWAKSTKEADDRLRQVCGDVWKAAPKVEQDAIYEYTSSYSKFNEPLRGIEYGTNAVKGVGNIDFDTIGTNYGGYRRGQVRKEINAMTDIIEKSTYDFDMWLQRGCGYGGMDNFFEISMYELQNASQAELECLLLGKTVTDYGFFSCGVSKGKGFSHKPIIMNVYVPRGTKMMYAEPFSAFGNGSGRSWNGIDRQSTFGSESEIILQQGTSFRVTKVEKSGGKLYVDIEVILQNTPQR